MKVVWYILIKNNIITGAFHSSYDYDKFRATINMDYDEIKMTDNFEGCVGMNINEIVDGTLKTIEQRILEGYQPLPNDKKIVDGKLIDKTLKEKIDEGILIVPEGYIYDSELDDIVLKPIEIIEPPKPIGLEDRPDDYNPLTPEEEEEARKNAKIEELINKKMRSLAIDLLIAEGKITQDGEIVE